MVNLGITSLNAPAISPQSMRARCFEIARECLAGDPLREVPTLEEETDRISFQYHGRELTQALIDEGRAADWLPAYLVATNALFLADDLADDEVAHG
jgi:hypothetical protein